MPFLFFNTQYLLFMLPALLLALFAQWRVSSTYRKYSEVRNLQGLTGADVARLPAASRATAVNAWVQRPSHSSMAFHVVE